ncbi:MAG: glycoside hydrolase family 76 protein [Niabella sp.]
MKTLQAPSGLFFDNINIKNSKIDPHFYSYNAGTMLQSSVLLYEIKKDTTYLNNALRIADASVKHFLADGKFRDSWWFNAVLLRGYQNLLAFDKDKTFVLAFQKALDSEIDRHRQTGKWELIKKRNLVDYGGLLECVARFAQMQKQHVIN